ncbi:glucan endo-1,3-beta-D-glucosidase [Sarracenia purpurea var. burkii]
MALLPFLLLAISIVSADEDAFIGVNIGTDLSDMPHPTQVVALLKAQQIRHVRLYNADRGLLLALANTGIKVTLSVPNEQLLGIGQSNSTAANWVSQNVVAHYPSTNITTICVGSEVLSTLPNAARVLVNALKFVHSALVASNLDRQIKVSTPLSSSIILDSFPPSQAFFNRSWNPIMVPMLSFLQSTNSIFMLNIYPYYDYMQSNGVIPLDYALFKSLPSNKEAIDANTLLHYSNVFDAMVDAAYFAMAFLNFTNIPVMVTESGWPSKGDSSEPDATLDNANTYNSNLIKHVLSKTGTPKHPGISVSTYIYELYNEDVKPGPLSEKNWGLFDANGVPVYILHLTGSGSVLANDTANQTYCTAKEGADAKMLQAALDWACGPGKVDCSPLLQGKSCYEPDTLPAHATYAFDTYYQKMGKVSGTCDFNGVATITTTNPSHGSCEFSRSDSKNGTFINSTAPALNMTSSGSLGLASSTSSIVLIGVLSWFYTTVYLLTIFWLIFYLLGVLDDDCFALTTLKRVLRGYGSDTLGSKLKMGDRHVEFLVVFDDSSL